MDGRVNLPNMLPPKDIEFAQTDSVQSLIWHLWSVFRRRWPVILGSSAIVMSLAMIWVLQIVPVYTASTQVLIDPRKDRLLRSDAALSELSLDNSSIATQVSLVQSFAIAKRVVEKLKLDANPQFVGVKSAPSLWSRLRQSIVELTSWLFDGPKRVAEPEAPESDVPPAVLAATDALQAGTSVHRMAASYF